MTIPQLETKAKEYKNNMGCYNENPKNYNYYWKLWSNTIDLICLISAKKNKKQ